MTATRESRGKFLNKAVLRNNGIARRLIVVLVLFSSAITTIVTVFELYLDYRADLRLIDERFQSIRKVLLPSLTASVWVAERSHVETHLEGLLNIPDIELAQIIVDGQPKWSAGALLSARRLEYVAPLIHRHRDQMVSIGELRVVASIDSVLGRIWDKVFVVLVSNSIKTFFVAMFMLIVFQAMVGQHLEFIAAYLRRIAGNIAESEDLRLNRPASGPWRPDALDYVVTAVNAMRGDLTRSMTGLLDSNRKLEAIIQSSPFALCTIERGNVVTIWNPGAEALFGWSRAEIVGRPFSDLLPGNAKAGLELRQKVANNSRDLSEVRYRRRDGSVVDVAVTIARLGPLSDEAHGYLLIAADITKWKATEEQLRQSQKMETLGQLTGGIGHDFNNLLGVILLNLDSLQIQVSDDENARPFVADCLAAAVSGANLTHRLLAFARQQVLSPRLVSVNELVAGMVALMRRTLGERIVVHLELVADPWPVFVDPAQIEASILNLATNARDAMPDGGRLWITTENRQLDADCALAHPGLVPGDYATIVVSDDGVGMTEEVRTRIFEPFYTTKERGRGIGLGLSMVFGFLRQSNGLITVYSEPGKGSTFRLYLPRSRIKPSDEPPILLGPPVYGNGETILVVEDHDLLRESVIRQLAGWNYRVLAAADPDSALDILADRTVDVVLTDIVMPGEMDGMGLAREILRRWPGIKIVLTTGFSASQMDTGDVVPPDRILNKPYHRDMLARMIRDTLDA